MGGVLVWSMAVGSIAVRHDGWQLLFLVTSHESWGAWPGGQPAAGCCQGSSDRGCSCGKNVPDRHP